MPDSDGPQTDVTGQTPWILSPTISTRTELSSLTPAPSLLGAALPGAWRRHPETQGRIAHWWVQQNDTTHFEKKKKKLSWTPIANVSKYPWTSQNISIKIKAHCWCHAAGETSGEMTIRHSWYGIAQPEDTKTENRKVHFKSFHWDNFTRRGEGVR